jgi:hypothetical protein
MPDRRGNGNAVRAAGPEQQTIQRDITGLPVVEQNFKAAMTGVEGTGLMLLNR